MKKIIILVLLFLIAIGNAYAVNPQAKRIDTDTTNFGRNLSAADTDVQAALETIDNMSVGVNWDEMPSIQSSGINWSSVITSDMSGTSVNWDSLVNFPSETDPDWNAWDGSTGINWSAMPSIQSAGINWVSIVNGEMQNVGLNWVSVTTSDMSSSGVNWNDLGITGSGGSQTPWTGDIDADDNNLENLKSLYFSDSQHGTIKMEDSETTDGAGKDLSIYSGKGNGTGSGGRLQLFGGTDGAAAYGGGELYLYGGESAAYGSAEIYDGSGNQGIQVSPSGISIYAVGFPISFGNSGYFGIFDFNDLQTANRTYKFPDASGQVALNRKVVYLKVIAEADALSAGDGQIHFIVPAEINGMNLIDAQAAVFTASSSGDVSVMISNSTDSTDMLSTVITIDASETTSFTAATPSVVDTNYDDVATGDSISVDVDGAGTGVTGLDVILSFEAA